MSNGRIAGLMCVGRMTIGVGLHASMMLRGANPGRERFAKLGGRIASEGEAHLRGHVHGRARALGEARVAVVQLAAAKVNRL